MSDADLRRMRDDLETIREAAGLELPFDRRDVWLTLALVPAGLVMTALGAFAPREHLYLGIVVLLLACLPGLLYRARKATTASDARKERKLEQAGMGILCVGMV